MIKLDGKPINITLFPDNCSQVWQIEKLRGPRDKKSLVEWHFDHEGEIMHLAQLKCLLDTYWSVTDLYIDYLPYGRQDKIVNNEFTFGLIPFANILNSMKFNRITIKDPHSYFALHLINNVVASYPEGILRNVVEKTDSDLICYPDDGALVKYSVVYFNSCFDYIYGEKVRNQQTGHIESYYLAGECEGRNVLIIDDICDGGATFVILTKELLTAGAKNVNLFVTHGLFTKGLRPLRDAGIKEIYTARGRAKENNIGIYYEEI